MSRQLLLILVALLSTSLAAKAATKNCDQPHLNYCSHNFLQFIGYNTTNYDLWKRYEPLYNFMMGKWTDVVGNAEGLVNICNGLEAFLGCLGPDNYALCTKTPYLVSMGTSLDEAYKIQGLLDQFTYQCGAGFFTALTENFQCLQRVEKHFNKTLQTCRQTFFVNVQRHPEGGCAEVQKLAYCYMMPFANAECRQSERADRWWACESQVAFAHPYNFCSFDCSDFFDYRNKNDAHQEWMKTHYKKTENGHMFKMGDSYEIKNGDLQVIEGEWIEEVNMI
ncbi:hypothetical protein QR680_003072 [Steinernema hermaphroditum]|uniref:DUF19 domain-containing protein n=1 Tax=Steinernema hermaphroditum TaxID=289476 RepID=A0AA39H7H0_9BILA|nr:hypothetical protein QR680_003072 [Steinernema hermaphroditum]